MLPSGLQADVFAQDELVLVVAPMHRWSEMRELNPDLLQEGELLLREQGSGIRESIALFGKRSMNWMGMVTVRQIWTRRHAFYREATGGKTLAGAELPPLPVTQCSLQEGQVRATFCFARVFPPASPQ